MPIVSKAGRSNIHAVIGVDVGGTFTDVVLAVHEGLFTQKILTTPDDPSVAVLEGLSLVLGDAQVGWSAVDRVMHGTTLISNALIERRGATCGLVTTMGFRDSIEVGRGFRYDNYDLQLEPVEPLVPRFRRHEVRERISASGEVLTSLSESDVVQALEALMSTGITSLAVCLLHSYANGDHERRVRSIAERVAPDLPVTLSCEVGPEIGEYERAVTTVANAYVRPLAEGYLRALSEGLSTRGFAGTFLIMRSDGGLTTPKIASEFPIMLLESGPAAGAMAAGLFADSLGFDKAIAFDMGGTTAKAAILNDGRPILTYHLEVAREHLFKSGSGLPIRSPAVDQVEIGAGGGSIAAVDAIGGLRVGPESAGASPGPVGYGLGGDRPTVTDADLITA